MSKRIAIIGGGWSGLTAAIQLVAQGKHVTVFEAAPQLGGRARSLQWQTDSATHTIDNGQHIMIGAYRATLALLKQIGVDERAVFKREALHITTPSGALFKGKAGWGPLKLALPIMASGNLTFDEKVALLRVTRALVKAPPPAGTTVAQWLASLQQPKKLCDLMWEPLAVAALNTAPQEADAVVYHRVLSDTLTAGSSASDLLLPRRGLSDVLPNAAQAFLVKHGATIHLRTPVRNIAKTDSGFAVEGAAFDAVVIATSPWVAEDLLRPLPQLKHTADQIAALNWRPITTVYLELATRWQPPASMTLLPDPAMPGGWWMFDRTPEDKTPSPASAGEGWGRAGGFEQRAASPASGGGLQATARTASEGKPSSLAKSTQQATTLLSVVASDSAPDDSGRRMFGRRALTVLKHYFANLPVATATNVVSEKRATFACVPHLARPANATPLAGLVIAGDYTDHPYPATLEGAVMSGLAAAGVLK
jgi:hydroxysqualene dehydroxylase